jgi:hypothetical protein
MDFKTKNRPATPLPWANQPADEYEGVLALVDDEMLEVAKVDDAKNAAYIAHAANAYPKLVEALYKRTYDGITVKDIRTLLLELGELAEGE